MELELDDRRQYLRSYNEYPAVIEFNNSNNHALPQQQISEPYKIIANNQTELEVKDNKAYLSKSPTGIVFGLIFGSLIIICGFFSEYIFTDTLYLTRIIILLIIGLFLLITVITLGISTQNTNKENNIFNCDNNSVISLNSLNLDPLLLEKMNIPIKSVICNVDNLNYVNNSISKTIFIGFSIVATIILFLLFLYGVMKKNQPNEFLLVSNMKYVFITLLIFITSSLMVCFKSAIQVNNKRYKCDDLTSFNERIKNIEGEEKQLSDEEKSNLENILKDHNLNIDSLICVNDLDTYMYQDGYVLKENKQTNNSFDGLLFFTYIVILSLLIAFVFGIILNGESEISTSNIIFLWVMSIFCLASIIYPWSLNTNPENDKKVNLTTGLIATIIPSILFIIYFIINALVS
jgi:hypothetical protein